MTNGPTQPPVPAHLNQVALNEIRDALLDIKKGLSSLTVEISDNSANKIAGALRPQQPQGSADLAAIFKIMRGPDVHKTGL